ncbi:MAG: zinc transporter ZntB, partial [Rhodospirillales bacterium]|nr:zinc transporter ZntB [Rhodospirillales bacterium]
RIMEANDALIVFLRGVNLNPGAEPDDMVSIRVFVEHNRIISLCHRRLMAVGDIIETIEPGKGPTSPGGFIVRLGERLTARMEPVIENLDDRVSQLEDAVLSQGEADLPDDFSDLRVTIIHLLRYLTPQREAFSELKTKSLSGITKAHRIRLAEISDRAFRYVEDLTSLRDRLTIIHDEIRVKSNERLNKSMYLLTLIASILLPPSLIAGLLGVNVGGIPGAETTWAFVAVILLVIVLGGIEVWILRRLKFI